MSEREPDFFQWLDAYHALVAHLKSPPWPEGLAAAVAFECRKALRKQFPQTVIPREVLQRLAATIEGRRR